MLNYFELDPETHFHTDGLEATIVPKRKGVRKSKKAKLTETDTGSGDGSQVVQMEASQAVVKPVQIGTGGAQVRALGSNVVQVAGSAVGGVKPVQMVGGKQTIVINKPGGGQQQIVTGGGGQQIVRTVGGQQTVSSGMKTVQHMTTSQAGAGT